MRIAIITGASSGMGKEFVKKVNQLNLDEIWGIALDEDGLNEVKKDIKTSFIGLTLDLTKAESFDIIKQKLEEIKPKVEILINCSGFGKFGRYDDLETASVLNMIDLNCRALVHLTELVLPYMPDGARIAQFSSVAGFQPVPYINVYAATKAFVVSYSRALNIELKSRKISVTCICPFWTKTAFFDRAVDQKNKVITYYAVMYDPQKVINKAYKDLMKRKEISCYGFIANAQRLMVKLLPHKLVMKVWCNQQKFDKKHK